MHVQAKLGPVSGTFLVDTGSSDTILSARMFHALRAEEKPVLKAMTVQSEQADGSPLSIIGCADLEVVVGTARVVLPVTIADIKNVGIIGMDFLEEAHCKIDINNQRLIVNGTEVPCLDSNSRSFCARIMVGETVSIPALHEVIISGKIKDNGDSVCGPGLIEPTEQSKMSEAGVMLARAVVDMDMVRSSLPLRVYNPTPNTITVAKGTVVGKLTPVVECESVSAESTVDHSVGNTMVPDHLTDLYESSVQELPVEQHSQIAKLLMDYQDVFSKGDGDLGRTDIIKHKIDTGAAAPIRQRARRLPTNHQEEVDRQVKDMLSRGIIEPSKSPWSAPIVLVTKKDGSKRFCVDYRRLNSVTVKDSYPIPRIDESLESLSGAKWFSTLDLCSGYWQVELDVDAREKSAFVVRGGLFQWRVMPFGLCNAPSTFERLMETIFAGLQWDTLLIYLDDIIVFGKTIEDELHRLRVVFQRLRKANLKLKPKKCALFQTSVSFLGHIVSASGISTEPDKVAAVSQWPTPTCVTNVRSFLGLASYYRRYIKDFGTIANPLNRLTDKNRAFVWTKECEEAFAKLKRCLVTSPILAYPAAKGQFYLDTDASNTGIGAVLSQEQDGIERVIGYASRTLSKPERNYCVTRRELLAVVTYLRHFRPYLYGRHIIIRTDHGALRWLINFKDPLGQVARWLEILGEYNYTVIHRPGRIHQNADSMSRRACTQCGMEPGELTTTSAESEKESRKTNLEVEEKGPREKTKGKNVHWKTDSQLVEIRHFEVDQTERVNTSRVREYFDHIGQCRVIRSHVRQQDSDQKHDSSKDETEVRTAGCGENLAGDIVRAEVERDMQGNQPDTDPIPITSDYVKSRHINLPSLWNEADMKLAQETDTDMSLVMKAKQREAPRPPWKDVSPLSKAAKAYWAEWDRLEIRQGLIHRRWESHDGKLIKWQLVVPEKYQEQIVKELHNARTAAHLGVNKTREKVAERFWWYGLTVHVRSWIRRCDICARRKSPTTRRRAPLQQEIPGHNLQRVAMDIMGPLPISSRGNKYILVVGDYFSKWIEAYPLPNQEAATCAKVLTEEWVCRHGCPRSLHSDQGTNFESHLMADVCKLLGIEKTRTTPLMPKSDGLIEKFNRTMIDTVAVLLDPEKHQRDWDEVLQYALMAYRSSVQESTGESPHMMMYGEDMVLPIDLYSSPVNQEHETELRTDYARELRHNLREAHDRARGALKKAAVRQKKCYDGKGVRREHLEVGSFVWLHNVVRRKGYNPKLQFKWEGPFLITTRLSDVVYRIQRSPKSKPRVIHFERLKPYQGCELTSWLTNASSGQETDSVDSPQKRGASSSAPTGTTSQ